MQRYFAKVIENKVLLDDGDIHHLLNVMRAKEGTNIEVVDNKTLYLCEVKNLNPLGIYTIKTLNFNPELDKKVVLFFALAKGDKIDFVVQKATELGVEKIVLFSSKRCVVDFSNKDINKKLDRYKKIAKEASEQSHRLIVPEILGVYKIEDINKEMLCDINYVAYEKLSYSDTFLNELKVKTSSSISVFIGPEGGFEEGEINRLEDLGVYPITLGKRILRTETAAVNILSVISYLIEKWDCLIF